MRFTNAEKIEAEDGGIQKSAECKKKGKLLTENISSSLFVGSEDKNAEKVPFKGAIENNFLLHFWPLVSQTYIPRIFSIINSNTTDEGFVLAIPEPSDLKAFIDDIKVFLKALESTTVK